MRVRIGTRSSKLARWQATAVADRLRALGADPVLVDVTTDGDRDVESPLTSIGGQGVFVKAIEQALLDGTVDLAVHSLKDMTTEPTPGLRVEAMLEREDPRDVLVARDRLTLAKLPPGSRVGTSSSRRVAMLSATRPDLTIEPLRGNVETRIGRVTSGRLDGAILAGAGLVRLGLESAITEWLPPTTFVPAPGQGVIAVQVGDANRDLVRMVRRMDSWASRVAADAERACLAVFGGGCAMPLGALATLDRAGQIHLTAFVADPAEEGRSWTITGAAPASRGAALGREIGHLLLEKSRAA